MSLITKMLNDLDKRQGASGQEQPIFVDVRLPSRSSRWGGRGPLFVSMIVVVAAVGGTLLWNQMREPDARLPAAPVAPMAAAPAKPAAAPAPLPALTQVASTQLPPAALPPVQLPPAQLPPTQPAPAQAAPAKPSPAPTVAAQAAAKPAPVASAAAPSAPPAPAPVATLPMTLTPQLAAPPAEAVTTPKVASTTSAASPEKPAAQKQEKEPAAKVAMTRKKQPPKEVFPGITKEVKPPSKQVADSQPVSFKVVSPKQQSENSHRQAISLVQESRVAEARQALRQSLGANSANHDARLMLAGLLTDPGDRAEAMALLRYGLEIAPGHTGFSMALAQIQVASGAKDEALSTLEKGLATAADDAEYHAFLAALQQSQGQHAKAMQHYITALRSNPSMPRWLIGVGISLQAENKLGDAVEAFQRALDTGELSPELARFAKQRLEQLRQKR